MAMIDSAYQYYLSTYGSSSVSRYDTHKKSQLRAVYNNIVKINKESPLYKIQYSGDVQKFAIDIKECTRSIQNMIAFLGSSDDSAENAFSKKVAESSDESVVSAAYVGSTADAETTLPFEIEVLQLATPQINTGNFLTPNGYDFKSGNYSFDLNTSLNSYEFQLGVTESNTNIEIQKKIVQLVNSANVGLSAELIYNDKNQSAIRLESLQTGKSDNSDYLFEILPTPDSVSIKAIQKLGISKVTELPQNSSFFLNGAARTSLSNTFTVNQAFEVTLNQPSAENTPTRVGFKANTDAIADNVESLVQVYNNIIQLSLNSSLQQSSRLLHDMDSVPKQYYNELESIGLQLHRDGFLTVDRNLLTDAISSADAANCFSTLNSFKNTLSEQAAAVSIDPLHYVDKVLVTYKNPGHNFATPYVLSVYSGMMLDCYC